MKYKKHVRSLLELTLPYIFILKPALGTTHEFATTRLKDVPRYPGPTSFNIATVHLTILISALFAALAIATPVESEEHRALQKRSCDGHPVPHPACPTESFQVMDSSALINNRGIIYCADLGSSAP